MRFPHNLNEIEFNKGGSAVRRHEKEIKKSPPKKFEKKSEDEDEKITALEEEISLLRQNEPYLDAQGREKLQILEGRLLKVREGGTDALVM